MTSSPNRQKLLTPPFQLMKPAHQSQDLLCPARTKPTVLAGGQSVHPPPRQHPPTVLYPSSPYCLWGEPPCLLESSPPQRKLTRGPGETHIDFHLHDCSRHKGHGSQKHPNCHLLQGAEEDRRRVDISPSHPDKPRVGPKGKASASPRPDYFPAKIATSGADTAL